MTADKKLLLPIERIERLILLIRGQKVMLDADLAELYGVHTNALNRAFQRNRDRFPEDFVFQLTENEFEDLRRQNWHLKMGWTALSPLRLY
jgi:ORF6N domain-containing protein